MKIFLLFSVLLLTACSDKSYSIAKIPEASGICFSKESNSLFVANDEGKIYEIDKNGKILRKKKLGKYDLEGVACDDQNGLLLFAVEGKNNILLVDKKTFKIKREANIKRKFENVKILKKNKGDGIEGITIFNNEIYISNQSYEDDFSLIFKIDSIHNDKAKIVDVINHGFIDIAGLARYDGFLYMISDKKNLLIKYDLKEKKTVLTKELPDFAGEGIAFDDQKNIYFADDNGAILKYKLEQLGL